jgi:ankyrin repeat protein
MILSKGCNVDIRGNEGNTALIFAARYGRNEICELLITKGCNLDLKNYDDETALMWAAKKGHKEICELLIKAGCKVDTRNDKSQNALDLATKDTKPIISAATKNVLSRGIHRIWKEIIPK